MSGFDNYLISGGLVAIFGWSRFNTPKTNRASTTLAQFYEWESEIDDLARPHAELLHRLETKYTSPHCI